MSEELKQALYHSMDKNLYKFKNLVLEAYDAGSVLVPPFDTAKREMCGILVDEEILRPPGWDNECSVYRLTDKGMEIAKKLDSERMRKPGILQVT